MRESRTYGSVRGALGNGRPYRDFAAILVERTCVKKLTRSAGGSPAQEGLGCVDEFRTAFRQ